MATLKKIQLKIGNKRLTNPKLLNAEIRRAANIAVGLSTQLLRGEMVKLAPKDQGILSNSIIASVKDTPTKIQGRIDMLFYGSFINTGFGGKGKLPNIDSIESWVRRKGLVPKGKRSKAAKAARDKKIRRVAFAVANKIARQGVKANPFVDKAITNTRKTIVQIFTNNLKKVT